MDQWFVIDRSAQDWLKFEWLTIPQRRRKRSALSNKLYYMITAINIQWRSTEEMSLIFTRGKASLHLSLLMDGGGRTHPVQVEFLTACLWIPLDQGRSTLVALHFIDRVLLENDRPVVGKECNKITSRASESWGSNWLSNENLKVLLQATAIYWRSFDTLYCNEINYYMWKWPHLRPNTYICLKPRLICTISNWSLNLTIKLIPNFWHKTSTTF